MGEYKKITKEDINFPLYCLFFISELQKAINETPLTLKPFEICIKTVFPYCSDAFELIIKTFERKGLNVMTPTYRLEWAKGVKYYNYRWKFSLLPNDIDDLPF